MAKLDFDATRSFRQKGMDFIAAYLQAVSNARKEMDVIYRGHASSAWIIEPSAFRPGVSGINTSADLKGWKRLAQRFVSPRPSSNIEWLILAQHYGIPTRLIDWTSNPLIALFFAVQVEGDAGGVVLQSDRKRFQQIEHLESVGTFVQVRAKPLLLDTSVSNIRSTAQDSLMTLHTPHDRTPVTEPVFSIAGRDKPYIISALADFGMTAPRVYADLTTAAQQYRGFLDEESKLADFYKEIGVEPDLPSDDPDDLCGL